MKFLFDIINYEFFFIKGDVEAYFIIFHFGVFLRCYNISQVLLNFLKLTSENFEISSFKSRFFLKNVF